MAEVDLTPPGPAPQPLRFPSAEARRALTAMRAHVEEWRGCLRVHADAATHARVGFEGQVRDGFDQDLDDAFGDAGYWLDTLEDDIDALEQLMRTAQARIAARDDDIAAWGQRMRDYQDATDTARRASYSAQP